MTRIAYHILAYREPERVARLVNRVQTDSDFVNIHFDTMIGAEKFKEWKKLIEVKCPNKNVNIVSEFRCKWGSIGSVDTYLSAIRHFENYEYDYFIPLSGECYPLKSPEDIKKVLGGKSCAFMEFFKLPSKNWWQGGLYRINNRFYFLPRRSYPYVWAIKIPRLKKGLPCNLEPYGGHGGFCLPKRHASYILRFVKDNPCLRQFFKRAWAPDELFFETILLNSPFKSEVVNDSKKYVDFSEMKSHPKNLTKADFENLKKSGKLFARKFKTEVDIDILDIIDQEIDKVNCDTSTGP
jgi:hypothetical protein